MMDHVGRREVERWGCCDAGVDYGKGRGEVSAKNGLEPWTWEELT